MLKIYITDLAAYNKGTLFGEWITLPIEEEKLDKAIAKMLRGGEAICAIEYGYEEHEEYFITDYEWDDVKLWDITEYENLSNLNGKLQQVEHLNSNELKRVGYLLSEGIAVDIDDSVDKCDDVIVHTNQTMKDVAYELINECYAVDKLPSIIANHIDYERIARDLEMDGPYHVVDNDVYEYCG